MKKSQEQLIRIKSPQMELPGISDVNQDFWVLSSIVRCQCSGFGSITDLLKWFSRINLCIFEQKPRHQVSGVRFQVSGIAKPET
jgi:hypothetical protein